MFRGKGWFSGGLWKPKNPHSLEHLKYLYHLLSKNQTVTDQNKSLLVETLRSIAEILIWGDQNDSTVFDFFLEKNMLSYFLKIMKQKCGRYVCIQLLQTLNILFENIRNETSLYYLLSNNHVNSIIVHKFDFSDEEVMAYYISFLKTLSLKLNSHTIHFFYNEHTNDFPLYTEAIKFFNHSESMVRIAVRTLTLNVFKVDDKAMLKFIRDKTAAPYFSNLVWFIGNHVLELDSCVRADMDQQGQGRLADLVAEHLDHLHYSNDILCLQIESLNDVLSDHLLNRLLVPLYVYSLTKRRRQSQIEDDRPHVSSVVSLFLLSQVFLIISHKPLVQQLAHIILNRDMSVFSSRHRHDSASTKGESSSEPEFVPPEESLEKSLESTIGPRCFNQSPLQERVPSDEDFPHCSTRLSTVNEIGSVSLETDIQVTEGLPDEVLSNEVEDSNDDVFIPNKPDQPEVHTQPEKTAEFIEGQNVTDEEKVQAAQRLSFTTLAKLHQEFTLTDRPFLEAIFNALECSENDHAGLFGLCLLYALGHNAGINQDLLDSVLMPTDRSETKILYNVHLVERLIKIIFLCCQYNSKVRLATLQMSLLLLKQLVVKDGTSFLEDRHLAAIEQSREESSQLLRNFFKSEEIFLDMFEDEYQEMMKRPLNVEYLMMDANLLLPPTGTPMSGISFNKRLPCGEVERTRRAIRVFFLLRDLSLTLRSEQENQLPLTNVSQCIQVDDVLDHNNSDLLGCIVVTKDGTKVRRFMVIDVFQLILVEPDTKRIGWGVTKFVGFLQDIEVTGDKDDSRCLHITVHRPAGAAANTYSNTNLCASASSANSRAPLLTARFIFDDNIRCMAAKQRLTKGRFKARQRKMHQIARLLELPDHIQPYPSPARHSLRPTSIASVPTNEMTNASALPRSHSQDTGLRGRSSSLAPSTGSHHHHHHHSHHHHGIYRPLFSSGSKVPGFATALRQENNGSSRNHSKNSQASGVVAVTAKETSGNGERHRRISGSPLANRKRGSSVTRSRDQSPRTRTYSTGTSSGGSEEIPLEDMSKGRGSRHNSPNLRRKSSTGLPQARISAPPYMPHLPLSSPNITSNKQSNDEEEEDVFLDRVSSHSRGSRSDQSTSSTDASLPQSNVPHSDSEGDSPKECTKPCCANDSVLVSQKEQDQDSSKKQRKTKGAIQTV